MQVLSRIIPIYDKMNRSMSFGMDIHWRREGLKGILKPGANVLDAGCGPGVMSRVAFELYPDLKITLLDPIDAMLEEAQTRVNNPSCTFTKGFFEDMPFPDATFNTVVCGFSIRDARNLDKALSEIKRVLNPNGGRLLIVEIGKPDNRLARWLLGGYWRLVVPFMALLRVGKRGLLYSAIYKTYRRHPTNSQLEAKLRSFFREVALSSKMGGGAVIITCSR